VSIVCDVFVHLPQGFTGQTNTVVDSGPGEQYSTPITSYTAPMEKLAAPPSSGPTDIKFHVRTGMIYHARSSAGQRQQTISPWLYSTKP
jgi:hypothetical protein